MSRAIEKDGNHPQPLLKKEGNTPVLKIERFEGPLEVLLRLIDDKELDITQVALAQVADQYLAFLNEQKARDWDPDILADFLVVAARLVYIKSKAIMPQIEFDEEEENARELERQLKILKLFLDASKVMGALAADKRRAFARRRIPQHLLHQEPRFLPPPNCTATLLAEAFSIILGELKPFLPPKHTSRRRQVSLEQKLADIRALIARVASTSFATFTKTAASKMEVIVSFLALLELIKQQTVAVEQHALFDDISISRK